MMPSGSVRTRTVPPTSSVDSGFDRLTPTLPSFCTVNRETHPICEPAVPAALELNTENTSASGAGSPCSDIRTA